MKIRINDRPDIQEIEVIINCVADDPLVNKIISALNTVDAKLFFGHLRQRSSIYGEQNQFGQRLGPDFCSLWIIRKKLLYHANMLEALNTLWG